MGAVSRPATIHDVARAAGVSIKTVSRVMNDEPAVRAETAERVRNAARALDYTVLAAARQLGGGRSRSLGMLIVARGQWQWTAELVAGAVARARLRAYALAPHVLALDDAAERATILALAARRAVDGLIVTTPWAEDEALLEALEARGAPFVLAPAPAEARRPGVRADEAAALEALTRHLLEHGHRRFAILAGQRGLDGTRQRLKGVRAALAEAGLDAKAVPSVFADYTFRTGLLEARKLLAQARPTALICFSDVLGAAALRACHEAGMTPPRQISVVGVGDLAVSQMVWPALTTAALPSAEIAAQAVDLLVDRIEGRAVPDAPVTLSPQLIIRSSSGPAPSATA